MVEVYYKQDEKTWDYTVVEGLEETIIFRTIQAELALKDIYQKVDWEQAKKDHQVSDKDLKEARIYHKEELL